MIYTNEIMKKNILLVYNFLMNNIFIKVIPFFLCLMYWELFFLCK